MNKRSLVLGLICATYGLLAGTLGVFEVRAGVAANGYAMSARAQSVGLMRCDAELSIPFATLQPRAVLEPRARRCSAQAMRVLRTSPTHGFAHYVVALAAFHGGEDDVRNRHMIASRRFAKFEGWLAERRFALTQFTGGGDVGASADIETLLTTQSGAEMLGGVYRVDKQFRSTIRPMLERAAPKDQQRFLNILKRAQG